MFVMSMGSFLDLIFIQYSQNGRLDSMMSCGSLGAFEQHRDVSASISDDHLILLQALGDHRHVFSD